MVAAHGHTGNGQNGHDSLMAMPTLESLDARMANVERSQQRMQDSVDSMRERMQINFSDQRVHMSTLQTCVDGMRLDVEENTAKLSTLVTKDNVATGWQLAIKIMSTPAVSVIVGVVTAYVLLKLGITAP